LYQRPLTGASNSGTFAGSTCWSRPQGDAKYPGAQYTLRGEDTDPKRPVVDEWGPWDEWSECDELCGGGSRNRMRVCKGENCIGSNIETEECNLKPCVTPVECQYVLVDPNDCPDHIDSLPDCRSDVNDGDLCEADYPLAGVKNHNMDNCPGGYDVFRYVCGEKVEDEWGSWDEWSECDELCGGGFRNRMRVCKGENCVGPNIETEECNLHPCATPVECQYVPVDASECPSHSGSRSLPDCRSDVSDGDLCEADYPLNGVERHNINNCPGGYDVFRYVCGEKVEDCDWVPVLSSECPFNPASFPNCHDSMDSGELCEADTTLPNGNVNFDIDNCGVYDIFRYQCGDSSNTPFWEAWSQWSDCSVDCGSGLQMRSRECNGSGCDGDSSQTQQCTLEPCDDDTATDSEFTDLGRGICRSSSGGVVAGWGGWPKSADQCKRMCESRNSCIGYTAVTTGGTGTCYVHGKFTENRPSGWFDANGDVYEIGRASGHYNLACYKRV